MIFLDALVTNFFHEHDYKLRIITITREIMALVKRKQENPFIINASTFVYADGCIWTSQRTAVFCNT